MSWSSDSESGDSDKNIRYKTDSTRNIQAPSSHIDEQIGPQLPPNINFKPQKVLGPELPPHLKKCNKILPENVSNTVIGPVLPPHLQKNISDLENNQQTVLGQALPVNLEENISESEDDGSNVTIGPEPLQKDPVEIIGPSLPPNLIKSDNSHNVMGPALPPHLQNRNAALKENNYIGPALPDHLRQQLSEAAESQESDDEEVYGPVPVGFSNSKAHVELEERALQMKIDMLTPQGEKEPTREEWMLELPAAKAANFGLGPRQFRNKEAPDLSDRSSWTDTPEDRAKKKDKKDKTPVDLRKDAEIREMKRRDKEQEAIAKKCKRPKESLVDMHVKKLKTKKDEAGPSERRPFSREVDLQVNRFDEAQKKAVLKKAQLLDTRFSAGESKFL